VIFACPAITTMTTLALDQGICREKDVNFRIKIFISTRQKYTKL
jgi:hypothetical protein